MLNARWIRMCLLVVVGAGWLTQLACSGPGAVDFSKQVSDTSFEERQNLSDWIYDQRALQVDISCRASAFETMASLKEPQDDAKRTKLCYLYMSQCRTSHDINKLKSPIPSTYFDRCNVSVQEFVTCVQDYNRQLANTDYYKEFRCENLPSSDQVLTVIKRKLEDIGDIPASCQRIEKNCRIFR